MKPKTMTILTIIGAITFCLTMFQSAIAASDEEEVLKIAQNWAKAFSNSDYELMSSIHWHSPELTKFTPSKGAPFLTEGWDAEEMKETLETPPGTFDLTIYNPNVTILTDDVAVIAAYQIMVLNPPLMPEPITNLDRLTLVVQKIGGKWLIVHSHQSHLPVE